MDEDIKNYWLEKYKEDKIGTIAKLSQAMQHMAWLREWQRMNGDNPRTKDTEDGRKINIAVQWSELDEYWREESEYGDELTAKILEGRIERGDISELTNKEIYNLSEKENLKWSEGKHSLNPFQGYLYDFTAKNAFILETPLGEEDYGKFYPVNEYRWADEFWQGPSDLMPNDSEHAVRTNQTHAAFQRYYTTRLMQQLLSSKRDSKYYDFVNFDITSVTTPEQIEELDKKLVEIVQSPEIQVELERLDGNKEFEKRFYKRLKEEVEIEIKKDSDRIENAHEVFVALETGNLDDLLKNDETREWAKSVYLKEFREKNKEAYKQFIEEILLSDDPCLDEMCWIKTIAQDEPYSDLETVDEPMSIREAMLDRLTEQPYYIKLEKIYGLHRDTWEYTNKIIPISECNDEQVIKMHEEAKIKEAERKEIESNNDPELDEEGEITVYYGYNMPYYSDYTIENKDDWLYSSKHLTNGDRLKMGEGKKIAIRTTKRKLIEKGLNPKKYNWKSLEQIKEEQKQAEEKAREEQKQSEAKVSSKSIIEADQKENATTKDLAPLEKNGFKKWLENVKEAFKNFITGKGEK